jgi:hypothetical protein
MKHGPKEAFVMNSEKDICQPLFVETLPGIPGMLRSDSGEFPSQHVETFPGDFREDLPLVAEVAICGRVAYLKSRSQFPDRESGLAPPLRQCRRFGDEGVPQVAVVIVRTRAPGSSFPFRPAQRKFNPPHETTALMLPS